VRLKSYNKILGQPEIYSRWVESAIGAHLLNQSLTEQINLYYWKESNYEVNFVLQKGNNSIEIEVKSGRNKLSTGIPVFSLRFNPTKILLVDREGIPIEEFLTIPVSDLFD
jgi:predicted AAA+ superfamily ATPase